MGHKGHHDSDHPKKDKAPEAPVEKKVAPATDAPKTDAPQESDAPASDAAAS
jgi:hypothetical protein